MQKLVFILLLLSLVLALGGQTYSREMEDQAKRGDLEAINDLGLCYYHGSGVAQSYSDAAYWWRKAANAGWADSQHNVGLCFAHGYGYSQDMTEAVKWYRKAAEQGIAASQNNLGICYDDGTGVEVNHDTAFYWYYQAATNGDMDGQFNYALRCYEGNGTAMDRVMTTTMFEKAAGQGHAAAANYLGACYLEGTCASKDLSKAYLWFLIADALGDENAATNLGNIEHLLTDKEIKAAKESSFYWLVNKGLQ